MARMPIKTLGWILAGVAVGALLNAKTIMAYRNQQKSNAELQSQVRLAEDKQRSLVIDKVRTNSQTEKERVAREQGYLKRNEQPLESVQEP